MREERGEATIQSSLACSALYRVRQWLRESWPHGRQARPGMLDRVDQPDEVVDAQQRSILSKRSVVQKGEGDLCGRVVVVYRERILFPEQSLLTMADGAGPSDKGADAVDAADVAGFALRRRSSRNHTRPHETRRRAMLQEQRTNCIARLPGSWTQDVVCFHVEKDTVIWKSTVWSSAHRLEACITIFQVQWDLSESELGLLVFLMIYLTRSSR